MSREGNRKEQHGRGWQLEGKVLVTGGTGSLGQAIVRRAKRDRWPVEFTILSRDEVKQGQMRAIYPQCRYLLGDVRDMDALEIACRGQDIVIHAAAYKQVPTAEVNAHETVKTNVCGSCNVAMAAVRANVKQVIGISTDKACSPVNLYGKSKAIMEAVFQQANTWGDTRFSLTRYGNVVGSRGSIIPLFQKQAAAGQSLTVTDRRMNRFWLSLQDAVDLIVQAWREPGAGTIVVPKLPSMLVVDLARVVWEMHGSLRGAALPAYIVDIGIRPGEKIDEHLLHRGESLHTEDRGEFYRVYPASSGYHGCLPDGFEYRTDTTELRLSYGGMQSMIRESEQEEQDV